MLAPSRATASRDALGVAAAIVYVFLWASAFVPSRILARGAPPLTVLSLRFLFAGGLLLVGARAARIAIPRDALSWIQVFLLGLGGNAIYLGFNYEALRRASAGMGVSSGRLATLDQGVLVEHPLRGAPQAAQGIGPPT